MTRALRVLMVEDSRNDAELIEAQLRRNGLQVITERVNSAPAFTFALREFAPDVVTSDHSLAHFNAPAAAEVLRALHPTAPLIVVSGVIDEQTAVACLRAGAEDIVLKQRLDRLLPAIESALSLRRRLATLSPRQLEVLQRVAEGYSTREIAHRLKLSLKTVETHRGELMKRLGIHGVVGLVRYAVRVGLVPQEP
jgi:DNA-binding NarL/FixJ family response regulator